jgi:DNA polymerase-3 subunit gamma/tau
VLETVESVARSGRDPARFARDLLGHLRVLLVTRTTGEIPEAFAVTASDTTRLRTQAEAIGPANLIRTIDEIADALVSIRNGDEARLAVEVALLKAARPDFDPATAGLLRRLERLEQGAAPRPQAPPAGEADTASEAAQPPPSQPLATEAAAMPPRAPVAPATPVTPAEPTAPEAAATAPEAGAASAEPAPTPVVDRVQAAAEPDRPGQAPGTPPGGGVGDLARVGQVWPAVLDALRANSSGPTASYFDGTRPVGLEGGKLVIGFPPGAQFNRRNAEKPERRKHLEQAVVSVLGGPLELEYTELGSDSESGGIASQSVPPEPVDGDAMVERVISEFNAEEVI